MNEGRKDIPQIEIGFYQYIWEGGWGGGEEGERVNSI